MAYFHFPVADMTYDIDPWYDLDLELREQCHQRIPVPEYLGVEPLFVFI